MVTRPAKSTKMNTPSNVQKANLHDISNQRRNLVSSSSSAAVFFTFTQLFSLV